MEEDELQNLKIPSDLEGGDDDDEESEDEGAFGEDPEGGLDEMFDRNE